MDYDNLKAFLTKRYKQCRSAHAFKLSKCYEVCRWDLDAKHKENPRVIISDGTQLWAQLKPPVLTDINDYIADLIEKIDVVPHFVVTSGKREASAATQQRDEEEEMESEDVTEDKNHNKKKRKRDKKSDSWEMKPTNKRRKLNALSASTPSREQKLVPNMSEEEFYLDSLFTNVEHYDKWDFAAKKSNIMMEVDDKSNILDLEPDENEEDKDGKDATTCAESGHFFVSRIYCRYCGKPGN
eukprot:63436_1